MRLITAQNEWIGRRVDSIHCDYVIRSQPVPGYPHGRMAKGMSELWDLVSLEDPPGILWLDCDVAADPDDYEAMAAVVSVLPEDLHTGLVKLWPTSTGRDTWIWSHRGGTLGAPVATQDESAPVAYVSTNFLWIPARLLQLAFPAGAAWQWSDIDVQLSEIALRNHIPAHAVLACRPKHLHFTAAHHWAPPGG